MDSLLEINGIALLQQKIATYHKTVSLLPNTFHVESPKKPNKLANATGGGNNFPEQLGERVPTVLPPVFNHSPLRGLITQWLEYKTLLQLRLSAKGKDLMIFLGN